MRGGTSKGVVIHADHLPAEAAARDRAILALFGSPDRRQIDGLGGADPLTSKLAVVAPPSRDDADVDYTFAQVLIDAPVVDWTGNCGNITAAVAAYAADAGLGSHDEAAGTAHVSIHCTNSGRLVLAEVPLVDGRAAEAGDLEIAGVPGSGAPIRLDFADTAGVAAGAVLPFGRAFELEDFPDVRLSVVDVGNPMAFVDRAAFEIAAGDGPDEIDPRADVIARLTAIRDEIGRRLGMTGPDGDVSSSIPLITLVGAPADYAHFGTGETVAVADMDLWARSIFLGRTHRAFGAAEATSLAAAAVIPGTVAADRTRVGAADRGVVRIGHPSGVMAVAVQVADAGGDPQVRRAVVTRTARRLMDGDAYVPDP